MKSFIKKGHKEQKGKGSAPCYVEFVNSLSHSGTEQVRLVWVNQFMLWTKRVVLYSAIFLGIVVFGCNAGVETGPNKTGSQYNGEQYDPYNLNKDK